MFDEVFEVVNVWIISEKINLFNIEMVVLLNIWSCWEDGIVDGVFGISGDLLSCWY